MKKCNCCNTLVSNKYIVVHHWYEPYGFDLGRQYICSSCNMILRSSVFGWSNKASHCLPSWDIQRLFIQSRNACLVNGKINKYMLNKYKLMLLEIVLIKYGNPTYVLDAYNNYIGDKNIQLRIKDKIFGGNSDAND